MSIYRPRRVTPLGVDGGLKIYGIAATAPLPRPELVAAARRLAATTAPGGTLGWATAHDARPACFVLVNWWRGVDLAQRYFRSPLDDPAALEPFEEGTVGCVWELAVTAHERLAWIRHMGGAPEDYLGDVLSGDV